MKFFLTSFLFIFINVVYPQDCSCEDSFNWVKETFEKNDAGFKYILEKKGQTAYALHNQKIASKIRSSKDKVECFKTINEWLTFFRKGHIAIRPLINLNKDASNTDSNSTTNDLFPNWEKVNIDLTTFKKQLSKKETPDFEGIWESAPYTIGVKKQGDHYIGFIIKADGVYWKKGQVKFKINTKDSSATYYMRDHSAQDFKKAELLGNNYLQMDFVILKRTFPAFSGDKKIERYFKSINSEIPYLEKVSENTVLLRIPSFAYTNKKKIDSVIEVNTQTITSTKNLIIDLRNNGGGSDGSYTKILPFLYTNPIRTIGVKLYSTPLNNDRYNKFISSPDFTKEDKQEFKRMLKKLNKKLGEYVNLNDSKVYIKKYDTIYSYPKNVGIIIHKGNASTTEQFILAAKQSKKVKLFGNTTFGALDVSNMNFVVSPCKEFQLGYCTSISFRIPEMAIDDIGLQPDYYIDDTIKKYNWIEFVETTLNQ